MRTVAYCQRLVNDSNRVSIGILCCEQAILAVFFFLFRSASHLLAVVVRRAKPALLARSPQKANNRERLGAISMV